MEQVEFPKISGTAFKCNSTHTRIGCLLISHALLEKITDMNVGLKLLSDHS